MATRLSARRRKLWQQNPHCYWCGEATVLDGSRKNPRLATVDHMFSRFNPWRTSTLVQRLDNFPITVLACFECNGWRGKLEEYLHRIRVANGEMHDIIRQANADLGGGRRLHRPNRYGRQSIERLANPNGPAGYSPFISDSDLRKSEQY